MRERVVQLHFLLRCITQYFSHGEMVHRWYRGRHLIIHVFYRQLEFEFAVQSHDVTFHIAEQEHQSIESGYHWNAYVFHCTGVISLGIVNDHCGEQIVALVGNLQIGGRHEGRIHLDHLAISSDISHI